MLLERGSSLVAEPMRLADLARRPEVPLSILLELAGLGSGQEDEIRSADIELKYAGYLTRERSAAARMNTMTDFKIPEELDYQGLNSLSFEAREKLHAIRPHTLGQASRIPGISPSDLQGLVFEVVRYRSEFGRRSVSRETHSEAPTDVTAFPQ
jgi:tRNA uridine 5-carboxymethylaminomethyl modification enzyme